MTAVILAIGMLFFFVAFHDRVIPALERIADAQVRSAAALEDIADTLDITLCDDEEDNHTSDSTRVVAALERIARLPAPEPQSQKKED